MRKLILTLSGVNTILNIMVIGIFMPPQVITLYSLSGTAALYGSRWLYAFYAVLPVLLAGAFMMIERKRESSSEDIRSTEIDDFLSGSSKRSDNIDMVCTWFLAVISWIMTGIALNNIENIGVIMPSIIVVMISAFVIFTSSMYNSEERLQICGVNVRWLDSDPDAKKRTKHLSVLSGVTSGIIGVCLAAWSLIVDNNIPNCAAVLQLLFLAFIMPFSYSRKICKKSDPKLSDTEQ